MSLSVTKDKIYAPLGNLVYLHTVCRHRSITVTNFASMVTITCESLPVNLAEASFPIASNIENNAFYNCTQLKTIVLRKNAIVSLSNINGFTTTPFEIGGKGGKLYVPAALINGYKSAENWNIILGYSNNQILPIEGSIYEE